MLTYGMIADRLSDLVAELEEYNNEKGPATLRERSNLSHVIDQIAVIRQECDRISVGRAFFDKASL
jgi:hypothetical protein